MTEKPIAVVTGVGPGTGSAIVRRFVAGGFRVIALARSPEDLDTLLDKPLETTLPSNVEPVHVCTFLWSEAALHDFLGDD